MSWLLPSLIATLTSTGVLLLLQLALYFHYRRPFLAWWSASWAVQLAALLLAVGLNAELRQPAQAQALYVLLLISAWMLQKGSYLFVGRSFNHGWTAFTLLAVGWTGLAPTLTPSPFWLDCPAFFANGLMMADTGLVILGLGRRDSPKPGPMLRLGGWALVAWGLHRMDYPFLKDVAWFAPAGFLAAAALTILVNAGLLAAFFENLRQEVAATKDALQESKQTLDSILAAAPVGIGLMKNRRVIWANDTAYRLTGYAPGSWLGQDLTSLYSTPEEYERVGRVVYGQLAATGYGSDQTVMRKQDGSLLHCQMQVLPLDPRDHDQGFIFAFTDLTTRKAMEDELRRTSRTLRAIQECQRAMLHAQDEAQLMGEVCRIVCDMGGYRLAWVGLLEGGRDGDKITPAAQWGFEEGYLETAAISASEEDTRGRGPLGKALRSGRPQMVQDVYADPCFEPWREEAIKRGYASVLGLPLSQEGRSFGVLGIYAREPQAFSEQEVVFLERLAQDLAFGLTSLRLRDSRRLSQVLIDTSSDSMLLLNAKGVIVFCNQAFASTLGKKVAELVGTAIENHVPPQLNSRRREVALRVLASGQPVEFEDTRGDRIFEYRMHPVPAPDGKPHYLAVYARDITERKDAEAALRENEERYRLLVESANEGIVVAQDGFPKFFNTRMLEITGFSAQEYSSRPFIEHVHPEDRQRVMDRHRSRSQGDRTANTEPFRIVDKQGQTKWIRPNGVFIEWEGRPATLGFFTDITESRQTEEALRESEGRFRLISENSYDLICLHDLDMNTHYASPSVRRLLGYEPEDIEGLPADGFLHPQDLPKLMDLRAQLARGEGHLLVREEIRLRNKDGRYLWMESLASPILDENGAIKLIQTVSRDITERKNNEATQVQMAAGVAHNFNNVLMAIMSNAQAALALQRQGDTDQVEIKGLLNNVVQGARSGRAVVQRLARFVGRGRDRLAVPEVVDVGRLLLSLGRMLDGMGPQQAQTDAVELELQLDSGLFVRGIGGELMEVFLNLAKNALEAMPAGGRLRIGGQTQDGQVVISFADEGHGLDAEAMARLFEPFFTTKGVGGQGLGLAVSKVIVQAHDGQMDGINLAGGGACFTVRLPLASAPPTQPRTAAPPPQPDLTLKVLLVEDEALVAMGVVATLKRAGHQAWHAATLAQAESALTTFVPDLVLCDLGLPDASGWQVCTRLSQAAEQAGLGRIPLVVLSGWSSDQLEDLDDAPCQPAAYLQKPVERAQLLETLALAASHRDPQGQPGHA